MIHHESDYSERRAKRCCKLEGLRLRRDILCGRRQEVGPAWIRDATTLIAKACGFQSRAKSQEKLARPEGFEPTTLCSGGTRSIHLSYGRATDRRGKKPRRHLHCKALSFGGQFRRNSAPGIRPDTACPAAIRTETFSRAAVRESAGPAFLSLRSCEPHSSTAPTSCYWRLDPFAARPPLPSVSSCSS